jgi:hypothetical protein
MSQTRLNSLAILSINSNIKIDIDKVLKKFALSTESGKSRRIKFSKKALQDEATAN